jgi:eukaryotic-like serine/threonine-protein kinase
MPLSPGTLLGPYELLAPIGAGGMGEVYRAKDTRLERTVAVKVLSSHLAASAESRQRFEREARTISQLSHPHICALYDVGREGETEYLVMEYLEGETLSDRLLKGALPFEQVLRFGAEIADALDKAHRSGIVHRDLKPGNVMLTKSGVKLLDFGLAKAMAVPGAGSGASLTAFPTQHGSNLTQEGTILGTFQYMAPEQLEGKEADARTDIFAFGALLYEMAAGRKAFSGGSQASLISSIMGSEPPPVSAVSPMTPPAFDRVVRTCLAKDPEDRWQTAHDVGVQLKWIGEGGSAAGVPAPVVAQRKTRERATWALIGLAAGALAVGALSTLFLRRATPAQPVRFDIGIPRKAELTGISVSPDGRRLALVLEDSPREGILWVRPVDSVALRPLEGTKNVRNSFWSPDGRSIGFFADGKLKRVDADGGSVQTICDGNGTGGGAWAPDGTILFSPEFGDVLYRVPASGGSPVAVTKLDATRQEVFHGWPHFLPDGKRFLYVARTVSPEKTVIRAGSLDSPDSPVIVRSDSGAVFVPPGVLLFGRERALLAQRFDSRALRVEGDAAAIEPRVRIDAADNQGLLSASSDGSVVAFGSGEPPREELTWVDRTGKKIASLGPPADYDDFALSPDGANVLATIRDPQQGTSDVWSVDVARGTRTRLTFDPRDDFGARWSPDGERIVFTSDREGFYNLYSVAGGGGGTTETVLKSELDKWSEDWSADGKYILYAVFDPRTKFDIFALPTAPGAKPIEVARTPFNEGGIRFSPNGRWLAYASDESGKPEVYVQSFPPSGFKRQISTAGGQFPRWSRNGRELFYISSDGRLNAIAVAEAGAKLETSPPTALFEIRGDVALSPDGGRFLTAVAVEDGSARPVTVVLNWDLGRKK